MTETDKIMDRLLRSYYCAIDAMPLPKRLSKRGNTYEHCACYNLNQCAYCAAYQSGSMKPSFPVPAIRQRTFESLRNLGYSSAENKFPIDVVFEHYIKR